MAAANFLACFNITAGFEGGYANDPHDPGGSTMDGVTQATYSMYLKAQGRSDAPVKGISLTDRQAIYHQYFWNPMRADELPAGLDLVMVDSAWGSGDREPIKWLQRCLSVKDDGLFGPNTMKALNLLLSNGTTTPALIRMVCEDRMAFFRSLSTWQYFGKGWTNRLNGIEADALKMSADAAKPSVAGPAPPAPATPGATSKDTSMVDSPAPTSAPAQVAPPVHIDAGDWLNQLIHMLEPEAEAGAEALAKLAAATIPGGTLILDIVGQKMVGQVVAEAATALEGLTSKLNISVNSNNAIETMALNVIETTIPKVASMFGPKLSGWISAEIANLTPKLNPSGAIGS